MKRILLSTIVLICLVASSSMSAAPKMISYQGLLTDSTGSPLDTTVSIVFTIYDALSAGNVKWSETHPSVIVSEGLFDIILGAVVPIQDTVFNQPNRFLGVTVGGYPEMFPRTQLVSVSYAHRVNTVDGASGGTVLGDVSIQSDLTVSGNVGVGTATPGEKLEVDGAIKFSVDGSVISRAPRVIRTTDSVSGCPPARPADTDLFTQTFSLDRSASVHITANMTRYATGRADLYLFVDGIRLDLTISSTSILEWQGAIVQWVGVLSPGSHTVSLRSPNDNVWGCGNLWGAINTIIFE